MAKTPKLLERDLQCSDYNVNRKRKNSFLTGRGLLGIRIREVLPPAGSGSGLKGKEKRKQEP